MGRDFTQSSNIIYLFGDEWPSVKKHVKEMLLQEDEWSPQTEAEYMRQLHLRSRHKYLFDPDFRRAVLPKSLLLLSPTSVGVHDFPSGLVNNDRVHGRALSKEDWTGACSWIDSFGIKTEQAKRHLKCGKSEFLGL